MGSTKINNWNFARVSPTDIFLYLISSVGVVSVSPTEENNYNFERGPTTELSFFYLPGSLQNQSQLLLALQKNKARP